MDMSDNEKKISSIKKETKNLKVKLIHLMMEKQ